METLRQLITTIPIDVLGATTKCFNDEIWRYLCASRLLLKSLDLITCNEDAEENDAYGNIGWTNELNDEKFNENKNLLIRSKIITNIVKERGLGLSLNKSMKEEEFILKLRNLPNVKSMKFGRNVYFSDTMLRGIGTLCKHLQCLDLSSVSKLALRYSIDELEGTLESLKKLKRLNLVYHVTDNTLDVIGSNNRALEHLNLSYCHEISEFGLQKLTKAIPGLKTLRLAFCTKISNDGITNVVKILNDLKVLSLDSCRQVEDQLLFQITKSCKNLIELNLNWCNLITNHGIIEIAKHLHSLRIIRLRGCKNIGDSSLFAFGSHQTKIEKIDINYCENVSNDGLKALLQGCSKLKAVNCCDSKITKAFTETLNK